MSDVGPSIFWDGHTVPKLRWVIVKIELLMLQSKISDCSAWHEIALNIASFIVTLFADNDVLLLLELLFESFLLVGFIGIKGFAGLDVFKRAIRFFPE